MSSATTIARRTCHVLAALFLIAGIALLVLNVFLLLLGLFSGFIMNPAYNRLIGVCLLLWMAAFIAAGGLRILVVTTLSGPPARGRCRGCDYDLRNIPGSDRCPECGLRK